MQIVLDQNEEQAVQRYADRHNMTYEQAYKKIINAMTDGLVQLALRDEATFNES